MHERARVDRLTEAAHANLVPPMRPTEYATLKADIAAHGIKVPLDVHAHQVLDGRHRLRIARELGLKDVPIREATLAGDDPVTWMIKAAVLRRHLSDDQRAMMAALLAKQHPKAKGGDQKSPVRRARNQSPPRRSASIRATKQPARREAAVTMNVAPKRAEKAATVLQANPNLAAQVHRGEVKLSAQAVRQVHHEHAREHARALPPPDGVFDCIVIDVPWRYDRQPSESGLRGECDYATMSLAGVESLRLDTAGGA